RGGVNVAPWSIAPGSRLAAALGHPQPVSAGGAVGATGARRLGLGRLIRLETELLPYAGLDGARDLRMLPQEVAGVLPALADALAIVGVPRAGLLDDAVTGGDGAQIGFFGDPDAVEDVELDLPERRRDLVLDDLHLGTAADDLVPVLDGSHAPDVEPHRRVELERVAARGGLGIAKHHTDLHADLGDEGADDPRLRTVPRELT